MSRRNSSDSLGIMLEAVRYAELERKDLAVDECGTMIRSVWTLLNPAGIASREKSVSTLFDGGDGNLIRFTAHSHDSEPLAESYDDIIVYHNMAAEGRKSAHYIVDRFCPKKII